MRRLNLMRTAPRQWRRAAAAPRSRQRPAVSSLSPKNPFDDRKRGRAPPPRRPLSKLTGALSAPDRRAAVVASYKKDLVRVLASLSAGDQVHTFVDSLREITRWVEEEETRASAKMTEDEIAGEQAKFLTKQAADAARGG